MVTVAKGKSLLVTESDYRVDPSSGHDALHAHLGEVITRRQSCQIMRIRSRGSFCGHRKRLSLLNHRFLDRGNLRANSGVDHRVRERRSARVEGIARRNLNYVPIEPLLHVARPQPSPQTLPSRLTDGRPVCQVRSQFRPTRSPVLLILHSELAARQPDPGVR
jgi:hypothetical protein